MKNFLKPFLLLLITTSSVISQHTFSIVAVDPVTGEIGSAGATCIGAEDGALAISDIILGVGAIHTQSFYTVQNQINARARMEAGDSPQEIMNWLVANDVSNNPSQRQYGAVDLNNGNPRSAAFTGNDCFAEFIDVTGPNYAIQGNILISEDVVTDMETAFLNTEGTLTDKLMAALQGAKRPGADSRCLNIGVSSASAFIRVADPSDTDSSYGNLSLDLNVWISSSSEIFEPIDAIQDLLDATLSTPDYRSSNKSIVVFPNPSNSRVTIQSSKGIMITAFEIFDVHGKLIQKTKTDSPKNNIILSVDDYNKGVYFVNIYEDTTTVTTKKIIIN